MTDDAIAVPPVPDRPKNMAGTIPDLLLVTSLAVADLYLATIWFNAPGSTLTVLAQHSALSMCFSLVSRHAMHRGRGEVLMNLSILLLLGPLGGMALFVLEMFAHDTEGKPNRRASKELQTGSTEQSESIYRSLRQGRRPQLTGELPQSFAHVFKHGDITSQYRAIATISRSYRPEMLPALKLALASDVPALRVQAAAVFAKLRGTFGERADRLIKSENRAVDLVGGEERARDLLEVGQSGFVDEELAGRLLELRAELQQQMLALCIPAPAFGSEAVASKDPAPPAMRPSLRRVSYGDGR